MDHNQAIENDAAPHSRSACNDKVRVLIVDDDPLVRGGLRMMLGGARGITVLGEAGDGDEVPKLLLAHRTDVVMMDIRMPRVGGPRFIRRGNLRRRRQHQESSRPGSQPARPASGP